MWRYVWDMIDSNDKDLRPDPPGPGAGDEPGLGGGHPGDPAAEDLPIGLRVGRNPANLGDEVADLGDVTFPDPAPRPAEI